MARNFNGGTDQLYWTIPGVPVNVGCIAFAFKTTGATANTAVLSYWGGTSRNGWGVLINNVANKITFAGYAAAANAVLIASSTSVNDGNLHYCAVNYDRNSGNGNELFVDGASEVSANSSVAWASASSNFFLCAGDNVDAFWASYVGDISEIGHWNVKLDAAEIAALAKGFSPKLIRPSALIQYGPLVRDTHEIRAGLAATVTGTTASDHPRILGGAI